MWVDEWLSWNWRDGLSIYINWFFAVFAPTDYPEEPPDLVVNSKKRVARWDEADATLSEASVMNIPVYHPWEDGLDANVLVV